MSSGIRAAVIGATAAAMLGLGTVPAYAGGATSCPSDGWITKGGRCTKMSNGILSAYTTNTGNYIKVNYYRTGGGALTAKLGYERHSANNWWGFQNMNSVPFHYEQSTGLTASCSAIIGKLYTSGGATYTTPAAQPC
ncbi:hypothetical protein [Streptomyces purpureus]|uniref:Secreted protein n=1 Tax=Streptomyces purpureus TaxID=1951 RepID=A0A918LMP1_9ACTN|nr:hypothetical protein [Streptomyces purpureus]GGT21834.1 hypothetical protein GCM10014713_13560 [Streptomyces purpureus]